MARSKTTKTRNALTYETLPALFTGICDAIRTKTGGSDPINHQAIPDAISNISTGATVIGFDTVTAPAYTKVQKDYTMAKAGSLKMIAVNHFTNGLSIKKNGTELTATSTVSSSTDYAKVIIVSVAAGDVIHIEGGNVSGVSTLYIVGVIE